MNRWMTAFLIAVAVVAASPARSDDDPLAAWRGGVRVRPVAPDTEGHTIHSYFNTCPESPDGKWVLFFASSKADGQFGEVRIRHRVSGEEKVLAKWEDLLDQLTNAHYRSPSLRGFAIRATTTPGNIWSETSS